MDISKTFSSLTLALFISMVLLYAMHLLIKSEAPLLPSYPVFNLEILKMPKDTSNESVITAPKPPGQVQEQPPKTPVIIDYDNPVFNYKDTPVSIPEKNIAIAPTNPSHNHITIVPIAPQYPPVLAQKCIEGSVVTGFTVTASGSVANPYIVNTTHQGFDRSALRAIKKFKFKPKMVDGTPVASPNARYKFTYNLDDC